LLLSLLLSQATYALASSEINQHKEEKQQQRELYQQAFKALQQHDIKQASPLIDQLSNYPLYPYLIYQRHRLTLNSFDAINLQQFSADFADTPLPNRLHKAWLNQLGKGKNWQTLLDNYQPKLANTSLQCLQLWALHQTGQTQKAFSQVAPLWVQGRSQPDSCDKLFTAWLESDHFTERHAWDRFWLALKSNNPGLAKYTSKHLQRPEWKSTAKQALKLHQKPQQLAKIKLDPAAAGYQQLVQNSLYRLGRRNPALALEQLQRFSKTLGLDIPQQQQLQRRFGLRLLRSYPESLEPLITQINPDQSDTALLEWQLRNLILRQDWPTIETLIDKLPVKKQLKGRWRYWKARALEAKPDAEANERAASLYAQLANERSFYGFLSADKLGNGYSLNNQTALPDKDFLDQLGDNSGLIRARELFYHQQRTDARREWRQATRNLSLAQHHQAAQLARRWGWYEQAIRSAISGRKWNDLMLRFPLAYGVEIAESAQGNQIDTSWILAIARQESAFTPDARSPAGAMGLMQLMPRTAKETAKRAKVRYKGSHQLTEPELNLKLGSYYLASLSRRYAGHRVLASAAYNAGPGRVNSWLEQRQDLPIDIWIETIPFDETRNYVQNILSFSVIYSDMLGLPKQLLRAHELRGEIPKS
tara:strand:+ start:681 stop:2621 length:1941 start_codon:yes stop_codon:yes gene_type:complete